MKLSIPRDQLLNPTPPRVFLCNTSRKIIGQLPATGVGLNAKWRSYSENNFDIQRTYVDLIDGITRVHPLYDKVEAPRNVLVENYGLFCLQDIDDTSSDNEVKSVSAFSLEYATSNKYLTNWHINTGEIDSKEVLYNEAEFGLDYSTDRDSFYKFADGEFNAFESYYQRQYTDADSYTYERIEIANQEEYDEKLQISNGADTPLSQKLYVKKFHNVQFYNADKVGLSLLHLVFENIPEWKIGNVDQSLWHKERQFSNDRISVYDFLMNDVSETFGCTFVWDSLTGLVNCYAEVEDDEMENEASTRFETDVYISKDNLASECKVSYSSDNIKTKLVVTGADDLDIREVNLGRNEIMDLSFYHTEDWMEQDLFEKYADYLDEIKEAQTGLDSYGLPSDKYPMSYPDAMQGWVSANNRYHELMHDVPAENNTLLVGDEFRKLFCIYTPIENEDNEEMILNSMNALVKKLNQYHVYEDIQGNKNDNILLKLKNAKSDVVTIRIYDPKTKASTYNPNYGYYIKNDNDTYTRINNIKNQTELDGYGSDVYTNNYTIQAMINYASGGTSAPSYWSMVINSTKPFSDWVRGELTAEEMGLVYYDATDTEQNSPIYYTVSHIGTMGAYFVLAKDEIVVQDSGILHTSQDYLKSCGINLLKEKRDVYTTLFQTQTEAMFSHEKYQCIVQDEEPTGTYKEGTRWLDSNAGQNDPILYEYKNATKDKEAHWSELKTLTENNEEVSANPTDDELYNYENYQRYLDNFNKLKSVQAMLIEKERQAIYCRDGYPVNDIPIDFASLKGDISIMEILENVVETHFNQFGEEHSNVVGVPTLTPWFLCKFTTSYDPITYGLNTKPYDPVEKYYVKNNSGAYNEIDIPNKEEFDKHAGQLYIVASGHEFAIYLKGDIPYISYSNSEGVYNMIMEYIREKTEMSEFFKDGDMWIRLSPFIKEDEYNDSNFLLTGYESEEERISIAKELMESATRELKSLCKPSLEFSMTMANILALPEFEPLIDQFQLGNFIKVEIREGYVKRTRLLEVNINFDDMSDFSATFGNLVSVKSEIDRHAELLSQAVTAGKTVAKSKTVWQHTVEKTNKLETDIANGLKDMALAIGNASGQAISWDHTGMHFRKYKDGSTTEFEPEEIAIINNSLVATNDSWLTSKAAFGKYTIDGEERWGPIAEYVTADKIEGKIISGGSLRIGGDKGEFIVTKDGEVIIRGTGGDEKYAAKQFVDAMSFQVMLVYEGTTVFINKNTDFCKITCEVYHNGEPITNEVLAQSGSNFVWTNSSDEQWEPTYATADGQNIKNQIIVNTDDIERNSQIKCSVTFDETQFKTDETEENETTTEGGASE